MDLLLCPLDKLLVLIPKHMNDAKITKKRCEEILRTFEKSHKYKVVLLHGTGDKPNYGKDKEEIKKSLKEFNLI